MATLQAEMENLADSIEKDAQSIGGHFEPPDTVTYIKTYMIELKAKRLREVYKYRLDIEEPEGEGPLGDIVQ